MRREAARRRAEAGARPERAAGRAQHAGEVAAVDSVEAGGGEERGAGVIGLDLGSHPLEPVEHRAPERAHALGVRRHEPQAGTARHRLSQPHPAHDPVGLGGRGHLPHHLLAPGLGRDRRRLREEHAAVAESSQQLEPGVQCAHDHRTNTCSHSGRSAARHRPLAVVRRGKGAATTSPARRRCPRGRGRRDPRLSDGSPARGRARRCT